MKKRMLSLLLALTMLFALVLPAHAASTKAVNAANALNQLGLLQGSGTDASGRPNFELDRTAVRYEGVTMLVRLLGKENDALTRTWYTPFNDVDAWADAYVGYAYSNGLTVGSGDGRTFSGKTTISVSQYLTFVLRALGYSSDTDFQWDKAWELADDIGLTHGEYNASTKNFTRGDMVIISYNALICRVRGTDQSLIQTLVAEGTVNRATASSLRLLPSTNPAPEDTVDSFLDTYNGWAGDINGVIRNLNSAGPATGDSELYYVQAARPYLDRAAEDLVALLNCCGSYENFAEIKRITNLVYQEHTTLQRNYPSITASNYVAFYNAFDSALDRINSYIQDLHDEYTFIAQRDYYDIITWE